MSELKDDELYILGNGASLKEVDLIHYLEKKKTIGTCVAFRYWKKIGIYPTYYCCVDGAVLKSHIESIKEMIQKKKCEVFLLCASIIQEWKDILQYDNVLYIQQLARSEMNPFRYLVDYCSGSSAVLFGYVLGYKNLNLLGMDCKYIEFIPECEELKDGTLKIIKEVKNNPNYFIDYYQQIGDIYNPPNVDTVHKKSWQDLRNLLLMYNGLTGDNIKLYNYNHNDTLDKFFKRKELIELPQNDMN